jgi:hypothetical protein
VFNVIDRKLMFDRLRGIQEYTTKFFR